MANVKISELANATVPLAGTEIVELVQGGINKKVAVSEIGGGGATPTLQEVTDSGNVTTNGIKALEVSLYDTADGDYNKITSQDGQYEFRYSATDEIFFVIDRRGFITIKDLNTGFQSTFNIEELNGNRNHKLPDLSGIVQVSDIKTSSFTSVNNGIYITSGTLTITDPTPVANKGYIVFVVSGTTTIDGVGYTANKLVYRFYNGTSWTSTVINGGGVAWGGITGTLSDQTDLAGYLIPTASTGNSVSFDKLRVYNYGSPATGNITEDLTGAKPAIVQVFYHQQATAFTVPAGWVNIGSVTPSTTLVNKFFVEWITGSVSHYWIAQIP